MVIAWIILSFAVGFMGTNRNIGFGGAFFLSLLLSPLIGIIFVLISKDKRDELWQNKMLEVMKNQKKPNHNSMDNGNNSFQRKQLEKSKMEIKEMIKIGVESLNLIPIEVNNCIPILISKSWKKIDNGCENEKILIFRDNKDLLIEQNDIITKNKWDYIESRNSILFDINESQLLYNILYIDKDKVILSTSSNKIRSYLLLAQEGSKEYSIDMYIAEIENKNV